VSHRTAKEGYRVLVSAPFGRDAESIAELLAVDGYDVRIFTDLAAIADAFDERCGLFLLTEEALRGDLTALQFILEAQPPWSDVPVVLLAARQTGPVRAHDVVRLRLPACFTNVTVLERPLSATSLTLTVASALRSRQRQFQMRDHMSELADERTRLATLLENLPIGVNFMDKDGVTVLSNPAFRRFVPDGVIPSNNSEAAQRWTGIDANGNRIRRDQYAGARALRGETATDLEFLYTPPQGDEIWTSVSAIPLRNEDGQVVGALSVVIDIDEQKRAKDTLQRFNDKLETQVAERTAALESVLDRLRTEAAERERAEAALRQSQKMEAVGQLTGGIAHDFNNMLTGVISAIDMVKRRLSAGRLTDLDKFMDAASSSAHRAASLTQRLLAFSRRQTLDPKPTDINGLLKSLEEFLRRTIGERVTLKIELGDDLPTGIIDANQLESSVLNLVINARDAMPEGGELVIRTAAAELNGEGNSHKQELKPGRYVVITVSDTGVGMEPELLEKVFDPFFTTKPLGQGTGLGLSMVYGFVKQSNGTVRIRSTPGKGTAVELYLPAVMGAGAAPEKNFVEQLPQGAGQTVLIVEDEPAVRMLVSEVLMDLGYKTLEADEPQSALPILASKREINLMISDVGLPGINGRQLAEIARQHRPELPILFITGYAENAAIRSGFLGTNMALLPKPFTFEALAAKISEILPPTA